jgi:FkbM family methyltransferase
MKFIKKIIKPLLTPRLLETYRYYNNFTDVSDEGVGKYFDSNKINYLNSLVPFKNGRIQFLGKELRFTHAPSLIHLVEEIFCEEIYMFEPSQAEPLIIDCGANIGVSVIFFKEKYPNAKVIAFEPDKEIFSILKENIESFGYSNVSLIDKAVWNKTEELTFYTEGALAGSITTDFTRSNNHIKISAVDFLQYIDQPIDLLKIDIEGAEYIVLKHISNKLSFVKHLFVEYHSERSKPQELDDLLTIIKQAGFRYHIKEAAALVKKPLIQISDGVYDLQLNIFCYR